MAQTATIGTHRTSIRTDDNVTRVKYHYTNVVTFDDSEIQLQSGGHHTATTKRRMNQTSSQFPLGYKVSQRNYQWYITYKGSEQLYTDGMILDRSQ